MATHTEFTQIQPPLVKDGQQATNAKDAHPGPVAEAVDPAAEQAHATAMTPQAAQELMVHLVRHGLNLSLRSLQVWADLARLFGPTPGGSTAAATMICRAYDAFDTALAAQREFVDQLVRIQRQSATILWYHPVSDQSILQ